MKQIKKIRTQKSRGPSKIESSRWLFTGYNAIGEIMFECLNCNSNMASGQSKRIYNYYICSGNINQGDAKCNAKCFVPKEWLEDKVINAIKSRFNPKYIDILVKAMNNAIDEENSDQLMAIKHLEKSLTEKEKAIQNIINALTKVENPRAIETLTKQLENIEQEKLELENDLAQLKKDKPDGKIDKKIILQLIDNLDIVMNEGSNKEKREIVRRFVRRLELDPIEGIVNVIFWPDPFSQDQERLKLIKKNNPGASDEGPGSYEMGWCRRPESNRYDHC
nr:zinc ribbon domain-containing protein [Desulfoscipio gibsoniae]